MILRFCLAAFAICVLSQHVSWGQNESIVPSYQVVFDDFRYDATGYPDPPAETNLFGDNSWTNRIGASGYEGPAWYFYNWRWQRRGGSIHPNGAIELNPNWPYSVRLTAHGGYTRSTAARDSVPVQIESGFSFDRGTWVINARLSDLENIRYFTQAFWIISPVVTDPEHGNIRSWVEFNHEWQNWFSVNYLPFSNGSVHSLLDDVWNETNEWAKRKGYSGKVFDSEALPSSSKRTYLANGLRMYEIDSQSLATGETAGGISVRNPFQPNASPFSCHHALNAVVTHIEDPDTCMDALRADLNGQSDPWIQLMIQYDGRAVIYSVYVPTPGKGHILMQSSAILNRRSLPLKVNLGIHTPNRNIVLDSLETSTLEIDWFYYSPETDLSPENVAKDVLNFRRLGWDRVNLEGVRLSPRRSRPWEVEKLEAPDEIDNNWLVTPTLRETSGIEVQWNYRTRAKGEAFFSSWSGWKNGSFSYNVEPQPYEIEMDVRVKDHHATDNRDQPRWASSPCVSFNYETRKTGACIGGIDEEYSFSFDQHPSDLTIDQVYPNPVRERATIRVGFQVEAPFELAVFDSLGRKHNTITKGTLPVGFHLLEWTPLGLSSGQYFLVLKSREQAYSLPVTVIK